MELSSALWPLCVRPSGHMVSLGPWGQTLPSCWNVLRSVVLLTSLLVSSLRAELTRHRQSCWDSHGIVLTHIAGAACVLVCGVWSRVHSLDDLRGSDVFAIFTADSPRNASFAT